MPSAPAAYREGRRRLADAQHEWAVHRPAAYTFLYHKRCFCRGASIVTRITERGERIVADSVVDSTWARLRGRSPWDSLTTVDGLFALIDSLYVRGADGVTVEYDSALHYPRVIRIDERREVRDGT